MADVVGEVVGVNVGEVVDEDVGVEVGELVKEVVGVVIWQSAKVPSITPSIILLITLAAVLHGPSKVDTSWIRPPAAQERAIIEVPRLYSAIPSLSTDTTCSQVAPENTSAVSMKSCLPEAATEEHTSGSLVPTPPHLTNSVLSSATCRAQLACSEVTRYCSPPKSTHITPESNAVVV